MHNAGTLFHCPAGSRFSFHAALLWKSVPLPLGRVIQKDNLLFLNGDWKPACEITSLFWRHKTQLVKTHKTLRLRGLAWSLDLCIYDVTLHHYPVLSPSSCCSDLKGVSVALRLLVEFPRRSGREEDTDTTEGFLLHFNTDGNSSTTGNTSGAGKSSCGTGGRAQQINTWAVRTRLVLNKWLLYY